MKRDYPCICGFEYRFHVSSDYPSITTDYFTDGTGGFIKNNEGDIVVFSGEHPHLRCDSFKPDNLTYVEQLAKKKGLV